MSSEQNCKCFSVLALVLPMSEGLACRRLIPVIERENVTRVADQIFGRCWRGFPSSSNQRMWPCTASIQFPRYTGGASPVAFATTRCCAVHTFTIIDHRQQILQMDLPLTCPDSDRLQLVCTFTQLRSLTFCQYSRGFGGGGGGRDGSGGNTAPGLAASLLAVLLSTAGISGDRLVSPLDVGSDTALLLLPLYSTLVNTGCCPGRGLMSNASSANQASSGSSSSGASCARLGIQGRVLCTPCKMLSSAT